MGSGESGRVQELPESDHQILSYREYMDEVAFEDLTGGSDLPSVVTDRNHLFALTNVFPWIKLQGFLCLYDHCEETRYLISAFTMTREGNTVYGRKLSLNISREQAQ